jgi:acrylyl-CoA reductase (NADPH)
MAPKAKRLKAWERLAADLDRNNLDELTERRPLADVTALAPEILAGRVRGRIVLEV